MKHVNRLGATYYAFEGVTKSGKPKYFASKKSSSDGGSPIDEMPDGFEFFENPTNATVVIRKIKTSDVTTSESKLLSELTVRHCDCPCRVVVEGNSLVVYAAQGSNLGISQLTSMFGASVSELSRFANYAPELKFDLFDQQRRTFLASRYCHRRSMEGWMRLSRMDGSLSELAKKLLPHIGKESFFELQ